MNRRNLWKYDETMEMLQIMKTNNFVRQFSNKHNKNMQIFRMIEQQMSARGYKTKSAEQICVRWKNIKNQYIKVKRSNSKNLQELFAFYEEMAELIDEKGNKSPQEAAAAPDDSAVSMPLAEENDTGDDKSPPVTWTSPRTAAVQQHMRTKVLKKRRSFITRGTIERKVRPSVSKLEATLASSKQELSDEFYRTQKRLIDYEFNLYMQKEEELIDQIQEKTRGMIEEYMDRFFNQLKEVVGEQAQIEQVTYIDEYEDHMEEEV
ncbi:hypothetical protein ZHAS_00016805 [Anopheles sinensis]|uniref:Myb/SANT-like DNA-binding domain-containing protein n=1 Tax=Anopheles sinensis TaxID=74873 RepID=A0A084WF00_ANOSI|nr:hypothetical protein ZHAS_00016805 [Anopheles sinensis]